MKQHHSVVANPRIAESDMVHFNPRRSFLQCLQREQTNLQFWEWSSMVKT